MNLLAPEPWPEMTGAVQASRGRVIAAVAYIGDDAPDLLPLKRNDLLVCDATETAVRNGTTSPSALTRFRRKGVEIHSVPGLHAKVVVLPRRAFVGSANASRTSRDAKLEAVLTTTDTTAVRDARKFVLSLTSAATRLDDAEIRLLTATAPTRVPATSTRRPTTPATRPDRVDSIYIEGFIWGQLTPRQEEKKSRTRTTARARASRLGTGALLESHLVEDRRAARGMDEGRWVVFIDDEDVVYPPGLIVAQHAVAGGNAVLQWIATPTWSGTPVTFDDLVAVLRRHGKREPYDGRLYQDPALVAAIWRLWRRKS